MEYYIYIYRERERERQKDRERETEREREILFNLKKERDPTICSNIDERIGHYTS
jgi:hypothetical protein